MFLSDVEESTGRDASRPGDGLGLMAEGEAGDPRSEFLARVHRFTDMMLNRLSEGSSGKDVDEKETRMLANLVLKALRIWEKALHADQPAPQLEESLSQARKKTALTKEGD